MMRKLPAANSNLSRAWHTSRRFLKTCDVAVESKIDDQKKFNQNLKITLKLKQIVPNLHFF